MTHQIKNQLNNHIDGELRDEVLWAIEHDKTSLVFYGSKVLIEKHEVDPYGNKFTLIKVDI